MKEIAGSNFGLGTRAATAWTAILDVALIDPADLGQAAAQQCILIL
jgi:hypothetical protein